MASNGIPASDKAEALAQESARIDKLREQNASKRNVGEKRSHPTTPNDRNIRARNNTGEEEVTIKDENLPYMRELRKHHISRCKADKQMKFLQQCLNKGNFPKQLLTKLSPQTPTKPMEFQIKWQKGLVTLASTLTTLLLEYWTTHYNTTDKEINNLTKLIKNNLNSKEASLIIKICEEAEIRFVENQARNVPKKTQQEIQKNSRTRNRPGGEPVTTPTD